MTNHISEATDTENTERNFDKRCFTMIQRSLSKTTLWMLLVAGVVLVLAACASQGGGDPAKIVEQYLTAKVAGDKDTMSRLLCSIMEANLNQEVESFASMQVALKD